MAATEVLWSPQARRDLLDLYVVIGLESPAAAERYFERIEAKAVVLAEHPCLGVRESRVRKSGNRFFAAILLSLLDERRIQISDAITL
ncbi:type II toxin-antitoxin system RelE/ParE family toxin [Bosea sp. 685]|uniref:type II toxin-antitoxin system RelE/ParE family toxin n=1 Tax=Bosea sp. 685 TaxID=3080057 RepID=UPI0039779264